MVSQSKKRIRRFSFAVKIVILDDELEFSKILDKKIKAYCARKDYCVEINVRNRCGCRAYLKFLFYRCHNSVNIVHLGIQGFFFDVLCF